MGTAKGDRERGGDNLRIQIYMPRFEARLSLLRCISNGKWGQWTASVKFGFN